MRVMILKRMVDSQGLDYKDLVKSVFAVFPRT